MNNFNNTNNHYPQNPNNPNNGYNGGYDNSNNDIYNNIANNELNMSNNISYSEVRYDDEEILSANRAKKLNKTGASVLTQSLLWFGLGFLLVAGLGSLWVYLINKYNNGMATIESDGFTVIWSLLGISLVASIIFSLFSSFSRRANSLAMTIFSYVFYILTFSLLFAVVSIVIGTLYPNEGKYIILTAFGVTGALTLLSGAIAAGLSLRGVLSLGKVLTIVLCVMLIGNIVFMIIFGFVIPKTLDYWYYIYDGLFCVVMVIFMIITFFKIIGYSRIVENVPLKKSEVTQLGICFGTEILVNFMIIFMYVMRLILRRE